MCAIMVHTRFVWHHVRQIIIIQLEMLVRDGTASYKTSVFDNGLCVHLHSVVKHVGMVELCKYHGMTELWVEQERREHKMTQIWRIMN